MEASDMLSAALPDRDAPLVTAPGRSHALGRANFEWLISVFDEMRDRRLLHHMRKGAANRRQSSTAHAWSWRNIVPVR